MTRDWKKISKMASEMEEGALLLSNPDYALSELPEGAAIVEFEAPVVGGKTSPTAKEIRSFLWENRKERKLTRDRAILWKKANQFGLGVVTSSQVLERLTHG